MTCIKPQNINLAIKASLSPEVQVLTIIPKIISIEVQVEFVPLINISGLFNLAISPAYTKLHSVTGLKFSFD